MLCIVLGKIRLRGVYSVPWLIDENYEDTQYWERPHNDNAIQKLENICSKCNWKFTRTRAMTYHKKWECGRTFTCETCGDVFNRLQVYRNHIRTCPKQSL